MKSTRDIARHRFLVFLALLTATFVSRAVAFAQVNPPITLMAAVLPSSRSVQVGTTATAFATIINAGTVTATSCGIELLSSIPVNFSYQTTDPATNALIGTPDTPVDIAAGRLQTYVFLLTPNAPIAPIEIEFSFGCSNTNPATTIVGVNTLQFTASATPVPDIIALAVGPKGYMPGTVVIPYWDSRTGTFAAATTNLGASANITVSADMGNAVLPMTITICESDPATGACSAAPTSTVTLTIDTNTTPTFNIFVQDNRDHSRDSGAGLFNPAVYRIYLRFRDQESIIRGSTSVAVAVLGAWDY